MDQKKWEMQFEEKIKQKELDRQERELDRQLQLEEFKILIQSFNKKDN